MSFLSKTGGVLEKLLGLDSQPALDARAGIGNVLNDGTIADASHPLSSDEGQRLVAALGAPRTVAYNEPNAAANDAAVGALRDHYENQFRNGGLEGQAAVQQAQLAGDLTSRGGVSGIRQDMLDSVGRQQRVASVAQAEMLAGGNAANALQASDANAALKRAVLAAQVSHANFQSAYERNAALFGLQNNQEQLKNYAQQAIQNAEYQRGTIDIEQQQQQAALGKALLTALTSAASGGISTAMAQSAATTPSTITAGSLPTASPGQMLGSYMLPGVQAGADASARTYQPIFNTPSSVPNTSNYWST